MISLSNLKSPTYIIISLAVPLLFSITAYNFTDITGLTAWCFFIFVAIHMLYGELSRRFNSMEHLKSGTASNIERFWMFMMMGSNLTHFCILAHIHFLSAQWKLPFNLEGLLWENIQGYAKLLVIFSLIHFALKPSVIKGQAAAVKYGERGYWRITKHPLLIHLVILSILFFLQRIDLANMHLWLIGYLIIGIAHQNSRNKEALEGKPTFTLTKMPIAVYEEFFKKPADDCFFRQDWILSLFLY